MYIVISKFYDKKTIVTSPLYVEYAKRAYIQKPDYDMYVDVFKTYKQAQKFHKEQMKG